MIRYKIGDVVRLKTDDDKQPSLVVRSIFLGNENISSEAFCVSECGRRIFWALSRHLELVNRPDPQADLKQAIREVLLGDEFMKAFAAAWVKTPLPIQEFAIGEPSTEARNEPA